MLDPAFVRDHLDDVRAGLRNRGLEADAELEQLATLEARAPAAAFPRSKG